MTKQNITRIILWILVATTCISVFCFSAQNATASGAASGRFIRALLSPFEFYNDMDSAAKEAFVSSVTTLVRKTAHFSIYAFLGFWLHFLLKSYFFKKSWLLTGLFSCAYAVSDEIHQYFVPGRSCEIRDVCIDTLGAFTGGAICMLIVFIWQKLKKKGD